MMSCRKFQTALIKFAECAADLDAIDHPREREARAQMIETAAQLMNSLGIAEIDEASVMSAIEKLESC